MVYLAPHTHTRGHTPKTLPLCGWLKGRVCCWAVRRVPG
jgi:hypothetical protein